MIGLKISSISVFHNVVWGGDRKPPLDPFLEMKRFMEEMRSSFNYELMAIKNLMGIHQRPPLQVAPPPGFNQYQYQPKMVFQPSQASGITIPQSSC